jgi:hypothetical protein
MIKMTKTVTGEATVKQAAGLASGRCPGSATKAAVCVLGGIVSLAGIMHGCFEILQGSSAPEGLIINAIGPGQRLWDYAALHAFTLVPNFLATGILAIAIGSLATIWAMAFIDRKYGPHVMFLLSVALFSVGGGSGPLFLGTISSLVATRIGKPLAWWRTRLPVGVKNILAALWPGIMVFYAMAYIFAVESTVFGWPLNALVDANTAYGIVLDSGYFLLAVMILAILSAFAHDIRTTEG